MIRHHLRKQLELDINFTIVTQSCISKDPTMNFKNSPLLNEILFFMFLLIYLAGLQRN